MNVRWIALLLVVAACTSTPVASKAPITSPTGLASQPRVSTPATPLPVAASPPALAQLIINCTIPVYSQTGGADSFLTFPGPSVKPAGQGGRYFDEANRRWLPVERQAVSPDGRRYAYTEGWAASPATAPRLHIANASTGADLRVVTMPDANPYVVADFAADGVYVIISYEGTAPGVWRVDPGTGSVTKVSDGYYVPAGPAWLSVVDPRDPNPYRSAETGQPYPDRVDRRDASGAITTWFYQPGVAVFAAGYVSPLQLLVMTLSGDPQQQTAYWFVSAPGQAFEMLKPADAALYADLAFFTAISDAHGIWFGGGASLYLATPTGVMLRVYDHSAFPANGCF